jgi:hypothetical protein
MPSMISQVLWIVSEIHFPRLPLKNDRAAPMG